MNSGGSVGGAFLLLFLIFALFYLIPTIVAILRKHKDAPAIGAVNILLGWTFFGWFVSLIWSLSDPSGRRGGTQTVVINTAQHNVAGTPNYHPAPHVEPVRPAPSPPTAPASQEATADDRDMAFWDSLTDKKDPDHLEEYLIRFPQGRFAQLARNRLERQGVSMPTSADAPIGVPPNIEEPAAPRPVQPSVCATCGAALEPDSKFCADCGATVPA